MAILIITLSWVLNACMDAIDHGKGAERLNLLWHVLKWLSYALPFGYIMWLTSMPIYVIIPLVLLLWGMWEVLYRFLRFINFYKLDK
jgi:hypothetical protein